MVVPDSSPDEERDDSADDANTSTKTPKNRIIYNLCNFCGEMSGSKEFAQWTRGNMDVVRSPLPLPFRCNYCGGLFCVNHHLPENHSCPNLHSKPIYIPLSKENKNAEKKTTLDAPEKKKSFENKKESSFKATECSMCGRHIYVGINSRKLPRFNSFICRGCGNTFCKYHLPKKEHKCPSYSPILDIVKIVVIVILIIVLFQGLLAYVPGLLI